MKKFVLALATVGALSASAPSLAQTVGVGVTFEPEERTRIKEYVVRERVAPVTIQEQISVGERLPADIELRTVPSAWGPSVSKYRYVYSGNRVYFVEPSSREVVHVLD